MRRHTPLPALGLLAILLLSAACGPMGNRAAPPTAANPMAAPTLTPLPATPTELGQAATTVATPLVPTATLPAAQPVRVDTADGVTLPGMQYGAGRTAVIFATTSDTHQATWASVAEGVAAAGYLALTFDFRFWQADDTRDISLMNAADADLLGAVAYARSQGAEQVVVIGASLGGLAAAKIAAPAELDGLVVLGAPMGDPALTIAVTPEELAAATMPKLFILSANDTTVPAAKTQAMYDAAADPKDLLVFPSAQHATELLIGPHAAELQAALLSFLTTHFPTN